MNPYYPDLPDDPWLHAQLDQLGYQNNIDVQVLAIQYLGRKPWPEYQALCWRRYQEALLEKERIITSHREVQSLRAGLIARLEEMRGQLAKLCSAALY